MLDLSSQYVTVRGVGVLELFSRCVAVGDVGADMDDHYLRIIDDRPT